VVTDWRPIETAPKDGRRILIYWPNYSYEVQGPGEPLIDIGWWTKNSRLNESSINWRPRLSASELLGLGESEASDEYFTNTGEWDCYGLSIKRHAPTHWLPLPPPPEDGR
jgi:hypothetical protein